MDLGEWINLAIVSLVPQWVSALFPPQESHLCLVTCQHINGIMPLFSALLGWFSCHLVFTAYWSTKPTYAFNVLKWYVLIDLLCVQVVWLIRPMEVYTSYQSHGGSHHSLCTACATSITTRLPLGFPEYWASVKVVMSCIMPNTEHTILLLIWRTELSFRVDAVNPLWYHQISEMARSTYRGKERQSKLAQS